MNHLIHYREHKDADARLFGPFDTDQAAVQWAAKHLSPGTWHYIDKVTEPGTVPTLLLEDVLTILNATYSKVQAIADLPLEQRAAEAAPLQRSLSNFTKQTTNPLYRSWAQALLVEVFVVGFNISRDRAQQALKDVTK